MELKWYEPGKHSLHYWSRLHTFGHCRQMSQFFCNYSCLYKNNVFIRPPKCAEVIFEAAQTMRTSSQPFTSPSLELRGGKPMREHLREKECLKTSDLESLWPKLSCFIPPLLTDHLFVSHTDLTALENGAGFLHFPLVPFWPYWEEGHKPHVKTPILQVSSPQNVPFTSKHHFPGPLIHISDVVVRRREKKGGREENKKQQLGSVYSLMVEGLQI